MYPPKIEKLRLKLIDELVATIEYVQFLRAEAIGADHIIVREEAKKRILERRLEQL